MKSFRSTDGVWWGVDVLVPSFSNAMVVFRHPAGETTRGDRYAWYQAHTSEASDPRARLSSERVLERLDDAVLAQLFRRSMPVHNERPRYVVS